MGSAWGKRRGKRHGWFSFYPPSLPPSWSDAPPFLPLLFLLFRPSGLDRWFCFRGRGLLFSRKKEMGRKESSYVAREVSLEEEEDLEKGRGGGGGRERERIPGVRESVCGEGGGRRRRIRGKKKKRFSVQGEGARKEEEEGRQENNLEASDVRKEGSGFGGPYTTTTTSSLLPLRKGSLNGNFPASSLFPPTTSTIRARCRGRRKKGVLLVEGPFEREREDLIWNGLMSLLPLSYSIFPPLPPPTCVGCRVAVPFRPLLPFLAKRTEAQPHREGGTEGRAQKCSPLMWGRERRGGVSGSQSTTTTFETYLLARSLLG